MNIIQTVAYKRWAFFLLSIDVVTIETELMYLLWQVWQVHFLPVHTTTRTWQFNSCVTIWLPCHNILYVSYWLISYFHTKIWQQFNNDVIAKLTHLKITFTSLIYLNNPVDNHHHRVMYFYKHVDKVKQYNTRFLCARIALLALRLLFKCNPCIIVVHNFNIIANAL